MRRCFVLDLESDRDLIAAYEARHAPGAVWPEVLRHIRQQGVLEMEIWRAADRLVMLCEVSEDYPRPLPPHSRVVQWENEMLLYQKPLPAASPDAKWLEMKRIFILPDTET